MRLSDQSCGIVITTVALFFVAQPAHAYLDPSTGSMILSAVVGIFATVGLAVKTYWYKLKAFFRRDDQPNVAGAEEQRAETESPAER